MLCPICNTEQQIVEDHHIYPIALGGPVTGPLITLCANCHRSVHFTANALFSKVMKTRKKATLYFQDQNVLDRAKPLISAILRAKTSHQDKEHDGNQPRRKMLTIQVSENEWVRFKKAARDRGVTAEKLVEQIVRQVSKSPNL